jgi:uncharacterized protein (DUF2336 family)
MAFSLSLDDVERLLAGPLPPVRIELAGKLARDLDEEGLTEAEVLLAQDIVRIMARDVEVTVRAALSASLRATLKLPHDVALRLAHDVEAVALPILTDSLVLTDADLVAIVRSGSSAKSVAIADRRDLSETVSDAVITHASEAAVTTLMRNDTARISEASLQHGVERFKDSEAVVGSMVRRSTLPTAVAERLAVIASEEFRNYLVQHHALSADVASDIVLRGRESAILRLGRGASAPELETLITQMHQNGRLTASLLLRAVCMGDIAFFEAALAVMAAVPLSNAQMLIHDAGRQGLAAIYRKAGLPQDMYLVFAAAVDAIASTTFDGRARDLERFRARVISRVLSQIEAMEPDDLEYLVDKLDDMLRIAA